MRFTEFITESSKICPQCGMKGCTCKPGKCNCKPKPGYPKNIDEAANPAQQAAIAIAKKKKQGVAEGENTGPQIIYATGPRTQGINDVDLVFKDLRTGKIVAHVVGNNNSLQEFALPGGGEDGGNLPERPPTYEIRMNNSKAPTYVAFGDPNQDSEHKVYKLGSKQPGEQAYYGMGMTLVSKLDWWSFLEKMLGEIMAEDDAIESGLVDRKGDGDLVFVKQQGVAEGENWSKHNHKRVGGMSDKSVKSYRRSHPGSKIQTAVTTKPSKIKKGSKDSKRRASFCARMRGMKKHNTSAKTAHDPDSNINKSLRRWHCESVEQLEQLVMLAEQKIRNLKK